MKKPGVPVIMSGTYRCRKERNRAVNAVRDLYLKKGWDDKAIMEDFSKYLKSLPIVPDVAAKILSFADSSEVSFKELENTIKLDPGIAAKILKVANSALYSRQNEIKSLQTAITLLGFKNIKSMVLLITASHAFTAKTNNRFYQYFWKHSIFTAFLAKDIARRTGSKSLEDDAFILGLLHDIGQAALYQYNPREYDQVFQEILKGTRSTHQIEDQLLGVNHKTVGEGIFRGWNFPEMFCDVAREHGAVNLTSRFKKTIMIVTVADKLSFSLLDNPMETKESGVFENSRRFLGLEEKDLEFYRTEFLSEIKKDPLYQEIGSLYNLAA